MKLRRIPVGTGSSPLLKRRGVIGLCLGIAAGLADRLTEPKAVEASHGPSDAVNALHVPQVNISGNQTTLQKNSGVGVTFNVVDNSPTGTGALIAQGIGSKYGVSGLSDSGTGVSGGSTSGPGAFFSSIDSVGFQGRSSTYVGVIGSSNGAVPLPAGTAPLTSYAGWFLGGHGVYIDGDLQVTGQKSAAVPFKDGELRRVFCVESPEAYFEDFGEASISGGSVTVKFDDDFAEIVHRDNYQVFLTPYGECKGLGVSRRGPNSFDVFELANGKSNVRFGYRILAPRGDGPRERLPRTIRPDRKKVQDEGAKFDQFVRERRGGRP